VRQVSRWENGQRPNPEEAERVFHVLSVAPAPVVAALAQALGFEVPEVEEPLAEVAQVVALPVGPPPPAPAPEPPAPLPVPAAPEEPMAPEDARPTPAELRASFDAVLLAAAEERDVLPRHLRAFAVRMFEAAARLGVSAEEAAALVAPASSERSTKSAKGSAPAP
jgi:hypothetical protein